MWIKCLINLKLNCIFRKINIEKILDRWDKVGLKSFNLIRLIKILKIKIKKLKKKISIRFDYVLKILYNARKVIFLFM
jgi:hypothetical protein